jgi:hypothetical protein
LRAADQTTYDTVPAVPADSLALAAVVEFAADNGTDAQSAEAVNGRTEYRRRCPNWRFAEHR